MSERDHFNGCTTPTTPPLALLDPDLLRAPPGAPTSVELVWAVVGRVA